MIYEGAKPRVCQETIYRYIYSKEGMAQELWWYLLEHRKSRRPRRARKRQKPKFDRDVSIMFRPDDVAHRRQFGDWEGDLMLFKQKLGQSNVTSLMERVSRFTVILKNSNKRTLPVIGKIMDAIRDLPQHARKSITFDRGPNSSAGRTCRPRSGRKPGSVIPPHRGRKALSKTPIEDMLNAKVPVSKIAAEIGRHRSTVYREIKRNYFYDDELPYLNGYYGMNAQKNASDRRARRRKLIRLEDLREHVVAQLKTGWTPE